MQGSLSGLVAASETPAAEPVVPAGGQLLDQALLCSLLLLWASTIQVSRSIQPENLCQVVEHAAEQEQHRTAEYAAEDVADHVSEWSGPDDD